MNTQAPMSTVNTASRMVVAWVRPRAMAWEASLASRTSVAARPIQIRDAAGTNQAPHNTRITRDRVIRSPHTSLIDRGLGTPALSTNQRSAVTAVP